MSSPISYNGYTGFWINWDKGRVLGSTLTLTSRNGAIFLAFLVIFVGFVAAQSWKTARFLAHHHRLCRQLSVAEGNAKEPPPGVTRNPQNGLFYQQQLVLRNEASDQAAAWTFFSLARVWRSHTTYIFHQSAPLIILATIHTMACSVLKCHATPSPSFSLLVLAVPFQRNLLLLLPKPFQGFRSAYPFRRGGLARMG